MVRHTSRMGRQLVMGPAAFSLIEVVIALGIVSFCLLAILGLFSSALRNAKESDDEIRAANITSSLVCRMRAAPRVDMTGYGFPFGVLTNASGGTVFSAPVDNPIYIKGDGTRAATATESLSNHGYAIAAEATYDATNHVARVALTLWWPSAASYSKASGKYEVTTYINTEVPGS